MIFRFGVLFCCRMISRRIIVSFRLEGILRSSSPTVCTTLVENQPAAGVTTAILSSGEFKQTKEPFILDLGRFLTREGGRGCPRVVEFAKDYFLTLFSRV